MSQYSVDPTVFVFPDESGTGPIVPVVVSLRFPDMNAETHRLMTDFTAVAFEAVRAAGGLPKLVDSAAADLVSVAEVFADATGVVFLGGGDIDGQLFGCTEPAPNSYGVDARADAYCIELIREAIDRDLPTLAICRGSQLLNVACGGTLIPDITQFSLHRGGAGEPVFVDEEVLLSPDSELARLFGTENLTVRSGHHQAVDRVGDDLRPTALAHDGIIEATQHTTASWVIGVQWHPEDPVANAQHRDTLFGELVERADHMMSQRALKLA